MIDAFATVHRALHRISLWAVWVGGFMLMLTAIMVTADVLSRKIFNVTMSGADEISGYVFGAATTWAYGYCLLHRSHIRIDALSRVMPQTWIRLSRVIVDLFAAVVCVIIAWQVYLYIQIEIEYEDTVLVDVPAWIIHGIMPLAFLLTAYRFLVNSIKRAVGVDTSDDKGMPL